MFLLQIAYCLLDESDLIVSKLFIAHNETKV